MGRIAKILGFERAKRNNIAVSDVKCDPGGGANITAEHTDAPGSDSHPLPGDFVAISGAAGTGRQTAVGYYDPVNEPKAQPGEKRIYARDASGVLIVELWLKNSGECVITNTRGTLALQPDGEFNINGARITTGGDVITAAGVSLDNHTHPQPADSDGDGQPDTGAPNK